MKLACPKCKELRLEIADLQKRLDDALTLLVRGETLRERIMLELILRGTNK